MTVAGVRPHKAVPVREEYPDGTARRECRTCGLPVEGFGSAVRHVGEPAPVDHPDPRYADTFTRAVDVLVRVGVPPEQARPLVLALLRDGLLRQRRHTG